MCSAPLAEHSVTLRPAPSMTGPNMYIAETSAPRKYGACGPGTLDTTMLYIGRNLGQAGVHPLCDTEQNRADDLAPVVEQRRADRRAVFLGDDARRRDRAVSRSTGSAIWVCSLAKMPETWLRAVQFGSVRAPTPAPGRSVRTSATHRGRGRTGGPAPPTRAITTSLTLTPKWSRDPLDVVEVEPGEGDFALRGDPAVEHGPRGGERESPSRGRRRHAPDGVDHRRAVAGSSRDQVQRPASRTGPDRRSRSATGRRPARPGPDPAAPVSGSALHSRDSMSAKVTPSASGVVNHEHDGQPSAAIEALDDPHLPQRPAVVEAQTGQVRRRAPRVPPGRRVREDRSGARAGRCRSRCPRTQTGKIEVQPAVGHLLPELRDRPQSHRQGVAEAVRSCSRRESSSSPAPAPRTLAGAALRFRGRGSCRRVR